MTKEMTPCTTPPVPRFAHRQALRHCLTSSHLSHRTSAVRGHASRIAAHAAALGARSRARRGDHWRALVGHDGQLWLPLPHHPDERGGEVVVELRALPVVE